MKDKILDTVVKMIMESQEIDSITVRNIAQESGANIALINYYFGSKDNLINQAVDICLSSFTSDLYKDISDTMSAKEKIIKMILGIADFSFRTDYLSQIAIKKDLDNGSIDTAQIILPLLRQVFPDKKDLDLKLLALQLISPIQVLYLNHEKYNMYLYTDLKNKEMRDKILIEMINQIIG